MQAGPLVTWVGCWGLCDSLQVHLGPSYMQFSQPLQQIVKFPSFLQTTQSPQTSPEWSLVTCSLLLQTMLGPQTLSLQYLLFAFACFFLLQSRIVLQSITLTMRPSFQNVNSEHLCAKMSLGMPVVCAVSVLGRVVWSCSMSVLMVRLVPCIL